MGSPGCGRIRIGRTWCIATPYERTSRERAGATWERGILANARGAAKKPKIMKISGIGWLPEVVMKVRDEGENGREALNRLIGRKAAHMGLKVDQRRGASFISVQQFAEETEAGRGRKSTHRL